jgi:carboxypeptidase D
MQLLSILALGGIAGTAFARSAREALYAEKNIVPRTPPSYSPRRSAPVKRQAKTIIPQTDKTASKCFEDSSSAH